MLVRKGEHESGDGECEHEQIHDYTWAYFEPLTFLNMNVGFDFGNNFSMTFGGSSKSRDLRLHSVSIVVANGGNVVSHLYSLHGLSIPGFFGHIQKHSWYATCESSANIVSA